MRPVIVAATRPNFVKVAPLLHEFAARGLPAHLVHTGQHYDAAMSDRFFADLDIREPDANLGIGSGSHAQQTAGVMVAFERWVDEHRPDAVIVVGDVNSTAACAMVAAKAGIPVAHLEAGLRSFDRTMPEEVNRIVVDGLSTWHLTPSADADVNLLAEGVDPSRIHLVGNIMVDSLLKNLDRARALDIAPAGVNKASALAGLATSMGIQAADVLAMGDGRNDVEMLTWAGRGVALGDAAPEVQATADHVTARFDQGGTAIELDRWFGRLARAA